jgi:short subunit dehydrogenase-like uncharacterized protein
MARANMLRPLLRRRLIVRLVQGVIERRVRPPTQTQRENTPAFVWGEVRNAAGQTKTARLRTANGYSLTVSSSLAFLENMPNESPYSGFATPGMLMGANFVTALPGSSAIRFD